MDRKQAVSAICAGKIVIETGINKKRMIRQTARRATGTAIMETLIGLFVLLPVFLLLLDVIALVIAQSVNDDLAKQGARLEANLSANDNGVAAQNYVGGTPYAGTAGLVTHATVDMSKYNWTDKTSVTVVTQVRCNLPVPVPLGGPSYQMFEAQATSAILGEPP